MQYYEDKNTGKKDEDIRARIKVRRRPDIQEYLETDNSIGESMQNETANV